MFGPCMIETVRIPEINPRSRRTTAFFPKEPTTVTLTLQTCGLSLNGYRRGPYIMVQIEIRVHF